MLAIVILKQICGVMLALFDIDGTLVRRAGSTHRDALVVGVRRVLGVESRNDNIPVHGMLDQDILMQMMANAGVSRRRARAAIPSICRVAERYYLRNAPDLRGKTCPGVRRLLALLKRRRAVLGLVSGNLERIGWRKLRRAGLAQYFRFGVFAERAPTRIALARIALREAEERGWINGHSRRVLIGDTPNDVEAGRLNGIETIGVATGLSSIEELAASNPSLCAPDLAHPSVRKLLDRLTMVAHPLPDGRGSESAPNRAAREASGCAASSDGVIRFGCRVPRAVPEASGP